MEDFACITLTPAELDHVDTAVASARAGGIAILDCSRADAKTMESAWYRLVEAIPTDALCGLRVGRNLQDQAIALLAPRSFRGYLLLCNSGGPSLHGRIVATAQPETRIIAEIVKADDVAYCEDAHAVLLRGHECGGLVGSDGAFILLQKVLPRTKLPIYVQGGIGLHTAAACRQAGCAGVVLEEQLFLMPESPSPAWIKTHLTGLGGQEAQPVGERLGISCRILVRPGLEGARQLQKLSDKIEIDRYDGCSNEDWPARAATLLGYGPNQAWPLGQAIGLAAGLQAQFRTTGRLIRAILRAAQVLPELASKQKALDANGPLALSHGTRYPIVQGPMTRVSDTADFAYAVAQGGALPLLALAMMQEGQVLNLLQQTQARMQGQPWGVGLLGFVSHTLREGQMRAITACKPHFAVIAGGRPDQANQFETMGIPAYIHVPATRLLRMFVEEGANRFIFEGRECGGHVGPLSSFALWESQITTLLECVPVTRREHIHVLFAGGIHDARSAAMVATMAAPLVATGMKVGVLMGTAYLFTHEAVTYGAIQPAFQQQALTCNHTVNLETGPGHASRCADTAFAKEFFATRSKLFAEGRSADEIKDALEALNLGRLRIATKGITRSASGTIEEIPEVEQLAQGMYMIGEVATLRDQTISIAELHDSVCQGQSKLLAAHGRAGTAKSGTKPVDVAIIGIGTLLPKAQEPERYWRNIIDRVVALGEVPASRWDWRLYFDADRKARDKIYSRWGGFIDEVAFDPMRFGIPPNSLRSIDPMQLLTLETVRRAMEDGDYQSGDFEREKTSVILGAGGGAGDLGTQYAVRSELPRFVEITSDALWDRLPEWTEESFAGMLLNVAAGRVTNRLDFGGVNFTVDAACASSLAAIYIACNELESGRSDVAFAGGIDTVQSPFGFLCFSKTQALSPRGEVNTFDQASDGIVISEGLAVVMLKRLADAERDGDRIYAVIKGIAGSSDGKALGLTAPLPAGQKRALRRAYDRAGYTPDTLGLVEAHGTGTVVGDAAETETVTSTLREHGAPARSVALGSIKTLIGHTKATAGVAGLIKMALALHHKTLPPHHGVSRPLAPIADPSSPVFLLDQARPWFRHPDHPRRAAVSAFGFGGTNFHATLEEYQDEFRTAANPVGARLWPCELFCLAAADRTQLRTTLADVLTGLKAGAEPRMADLALSLLHHGGNNGYRLAFVARTLGEISTAITRVLGHLDQGEKLPPGIHLANTTASKLALLFPGQGAQYPGMLREAALYLPELRASIEAVDRVVPLIDARLLSQIVYPPAAFSESELEQQRQAVTDTRIAQPAIGAISVGLLDLLLSLGCAPDMVCGHSYGEYTALAAGGVLSREDFLVLSRERGAAMGWACAQPNAGTMAAVLAPREQVSTLASTIPELVVANHNGPRQTVVSGSRVAIEAFLQAADAAGVTSRPLPVAGAFHSPLMETAQARLSGAIATARFQSPKVTVYGNSDGSPYVGDESALRKRLDNHLLSTVEFVACIERLYADGARYFVEVGPKTILTGLTSQILGERPHQGISLDRNEGELAGVLDGLARLFVSGHLPNLVKLFDTRACTVFPLRQLAAQRPHQPSPTTWLISGGCARQPDQPAGRTGKLPPLTLDTREDARAALISAHTPAPIVQSPPVDHAPLTVSTATSATAGMMDVAALAAYHETMRQFLQLQESVMAHFLGGSAGQAVMPTPATLAPPSVPTFTTPEIVPTVVPPLTAASLPTPNTQAPQPTVASWSAETLTTQLLALVSERTGYPPEMLGLEADMEAELGIDSIKRVEILGALQKALPDALAAKVKGAMERFTRVKNLASLVTEIITLAPSASAPAITSIEPEPGPVVAAAPLPTSTALTAQLLALVSERTGYPPEMLGLEADMEAELGIDSIKRVEILGALQKALPATLATQIKSAMERFTRVKTLAGLVAEVIALSPFDPAPKITSAEAEISLVAEAPALTAETLTAQLLALVSERTGYPPEMLGLQADMEAELGIDSIKRVEILGALQKALPDTLAAQVKGAMERFTRVKTLASLVAEIITLAPSAAPKSNKDVDTITQPLPPPVAISGAVLPRYTPVAVASPLTVDSAWQPSGLIILTQDSLSIAELLTARLRDLGAHPVLLSIADLTAPTTLAQQLATLRQQYGPVSAVLHLQALGLEIPNTIDITLTWLQRVHQCAGSLFTMIKACEPELAAGRLRILALSAMGGQFGRDAQGRGHPAAGGATGMLKTLVAEYPRCHAKALDVDPAQAPATLVQTVWDELVTYDKRVEVGYPGGVRHIFKTRQSSTSGLSRTSIPSDAVVLATGGARGITAEIVEELVGPNMNLILLGRTTPTAEEPADLAALTALPDLRTWFIREAREQGDSLSPAQIEGRVQACLRDREVRSVLVRLRQRAKQVIYHPVDVADYTALNATLDTILKQHGRVDVLLHGAGVIEDKLISDKTLDSFTRVIDTKLASAWTLLQRLAPQLKVAVLFASVAGRYGNRGQVDYATANEILNRLAWWWQPRMSGRVVAINWGPWDSTGMASEDAKLQFRERGVIPIPVSAGRRYCLEELRLAIAAGCEVIAGAGPWEAHDDQRALLAGVGPAEDSPRFQAQSQQNGSVVAQRRFSREVDTWLQDHQLDGKPVLPAACAAEWMARLAAQGWPDQQVIAISGLRQLRGVILENGHFDAEFHTRASSHADAESLQVATELRMTGSPQLHYRASVQLARQPLDTTTPELPALTDGDAIPPARLYRNYLFHGPAFQTLSEVRVSPAGAWARVQPAQWQAAEGGAWLFDPVLTDSILQLAMVWSRHVHDTSAFPAQIGRLERYPQVSTAGGLELRFRVAAESDAHSVLFNAEVINSAGTVVLRLTDGHSHGSAALNRLIDSR